MYAVPFPDLTRKQLGHRVRALTQAFGLSRTDAEDLTSEFVTELLRAERRFDPARASRPTYLAAVLDLKHKRLCRDLGRAWRRSRATPPPPRLETDAATVADLRADVDAVVAKLPPDLAAVARGLQRWSVAQIAELRGVHRGTVHRDVQRLRPHFARLGGVA